jgi:hypothetical protein
MCLTLLGILKINLIHVCICTSIISLCTKEIPDGDLLEIETSRKTDKKCRNDVLIARI